MFLELLPVVYVGTVIFILGAIIGSFLDVFITRFHTGTSINGRSRCLSCGHTLVWYELVPFVSYIALRGRCAHCGGYIPVRLLCMEIITGGLFLYVYTQSLSLESLGIGFMLMALLLVIVVYDIQHMVIPHEFVFALLCMALLVLWFKAGFSFNAVLFATHALSAAGVSLFFGSLWFISRGRWIGLGDAKLAFPLALMLSPLAAFSMVVFSFWIGAILSIMLLLLQRILSSGKRHLPFVRVPLTMKSEVPFAPFLIAAFVLVYMHHVQVLTVMADLF